MTKTAARASTRCMTSIDDVVCRADLEAALQNLGITDAQITRTRHGSVLVTFGHAPRPRAAKRPPILSCLPAPLAHRLEESDKWFGRDLTKPSALSRAYDRARAAA